MEKLIRRNAVLYKEMTRDMKRSKVIVIMLIINALLALIGAGFMAYITIAAALYERIWQATFVAYFITIVSVEMLVILFITPAVTAGSISTERERQTLDVLLTTRMTPWEIIKGKYLADVIFLTLMVFSTMPLLSLVFVYGGVNIFQMLAILLVLIVSIMFEAAFGIFFSALTKRTVPSVILSYVTFYLICITVSFAVPFGISEVCIAIEDVIEKTVFMYNPTINWNTHCIPYEYVFVLSYLNPVFTLVDCIGATIGIGEFTGIKSIVREISNSSRGGYDLFVSERNIGVVLWTPMSMALQLVAAYGLLRLSAVCLNPLKGRKKSKRK